MAPYLQIYPTRQSLDPALQARIKREVDLGHFPDAPTVLSNALDLLLLTPEQEEWLHCNREALNERLEESLAQAQRGETLHRRRSPAHPG